MKQLFLFVFLIINFVGSIESATAANVYHGNRRHWTIEANGTTHIALHILKEPVRLIFPKTKTFPQLLSGLKLYSPAGNEKCENATNILKFTLLITDLYDIHGEIKVVSNRLRAYLFEKCAGGEGPDHYDSPLIDIRPADIENDNSRLCPDAGIPLQTYKNDDTKYVVELEASGNLECQVFMELKMSYW
uniref:Uncharacterized protein n=1 Tax=Panagrolaimus superbus TaxID=310955 RepID=A0A914YB32_9BILA